MPTDHDRQHAATLVANGAPVRINYSTESTEPDEEARSFLLTGTHAREWRREWDRVICTPDVRTASAYAVDGEAGWTLAEYEYDLRAPLTSTILLHANVETAWNDPRTPDDFGRVVAEAFAMAEDSPDSAYPGVRLEGVSPARLEVVLRERTETAPETLWECSCGSAPFGTPEEVHAHIGHWHTTERGDDPGDYYPVPLYV